MLFGSHTHLKIDFISEGTLLGGDELTIATGIDPNSRTLFGHTGVFALPGYDNPLGAEYILRGRDHE